MVRACRPRCNIGGVRGCIQLEMRRACRPRCDIGGVRGCIQLEMGRACRPGCDMARASGADAWRVGGVSRITAGSGPPKGSTSGLVGSRRSTATERWDPLRVLDLPTRKSRFALPSRWCRDVASQGGPLDVPAGAPVRIARGPERGSTLRSPPAPPPPQAPPPPPQAPPPPPPPRSAPSTPRASCRRTVPGAIRGLASEGSPAPVSVQRRVGVPREWRPVSSFRARPVAAIPGVSRRSAVGSRAPIVG
jgi:hypothetical protein